MSAQILQFASQFTLYTGCIIFSLGVIGNTLNILVFTHLKLFRENRCTFYLTIESISNFFYLLISISLTILTSIYGDDATGRSSVWCKFRYILGQTCVVNAYYITCFAAIDQFFSTNYRLYLRQMLTMKLTRCIIFIIICFSIAHSIALGLSYDVQAGIGCMMSNPVWLQYSTYFFYPVLVGLFPLAIVFFFSILAFRNVRRIVRKQIPIVRRRLDQQMTAMVLLRSIVFVFLSSPYGVYRVYTINYPVPKTKPLEYAIGRLIQAIFVSFVGLNYAASFYVFMILSSRFRRQVKLVLKKRCWQRWKSWCCCGSNRITPEIGETRVETAEVDDDASEQYAR